MILNTSVEHPLLEMQFVGTVGALFLQRVAPLRISGADQTCWCCDSDTRVCTCVTGLLLMELSRVHRQIG